MSERKTTHRAEVASHVPGRLRVRLHPDSRHPHIMHKLKQDLANHPGVRDVTVNPVTGSVTVMYDAQTHSGSGILGVLEDLDVIVGTVLHAPHIGGAARGHSTTAITLAEALDDIDRRISALTGHTLDLRVLFPLSLVGLGVWQTMVTGLMLETIPGWLLVWLGFDAFLKLHQPTPAALPAPAPAAAQGAVPPATVAPAER
ncbi:MAG TPA: hypothetical protein VKJ47_14875 [Candidatus Binatia bacterium]|nr:hypothetical protein [Candidatus Binatia bacterium]